MRNIIHLVNKEMREEYDIMSIEFPDGPITAPNKAKVYSYGDFSFEYVRYLYEVAYSEYEDGIHKAINLREMLKSQYTNYPFNVFLESHNKGYGKLSPFITKINLYEGSDIYGELEIKEGKGYLTYFYLGKEALINNEYVFNHNKDTVNIIIELAEKICNTHKSTLWSY